MKPASEWDEDYLLNLPSLEPTNLDFKGRGGLDLTLTNVNRDRIKNELSVELSAFANSGGGLIIFGVKNPVPVQPLEIDDGGVDIAMRGSSTKEWLENVIPSLTDYSLPSFEVHVIEAKKPNSQILPGRAVFVVEVPDSERAPHQANDYKYYVRLGGTSQAIGHQFVMDIAGRRQYPIINIGIQMRSNLEWKDESLWQNLPLPENNVRTVNLVIGMHNIGRVYAQYVNCYLYIPKELVISQRRSQIERIYGIECYKLEIDNSTPTGTFYPILPQVKYEYSEDNLLSSFRQSGQLSGAYEIRWQVYADNAPPREGKIQLKDISLFSRDGIQVNTN